MADSFPKIANWNIKEKLGGGGQGMTTPQATGAAAYNLLLEREPVAGADLSLNSRITLANFKAKAAQRFVLAQAMRYRHNKRFRHRNST